MKMLNAQYCRDTLAQLLWCIAIMSENQTRCGSDDRVQSEFFDLITGGVGYLFRGLESRSHPHSDRRKFRREESACEVF